MADDCPNIRCVVHVTLCVFLLGLCLAVILVLPDPLDRGVLCGDTSIIYKYHSETVNKLTLFLLTFGSVSATVIIVDSYRTKCNNWNPQLSIGRKLACLGELGRSFQRILMSASGCSAAWLLAAIIKITVAKYRPSFIDRCQGDAWSSIACTQGELVYFPQFNCRDEDLGIYMQSFPSAHACVIFYAAMFNCAYIHRRLPKGQFLNMIGLICYLVNAGMALWVSSTRVKDNDHDLEDVLAGSVIGVVTGYTVAKAAITTRGQGDGRCCTEKDNQAETREQITAREENGISRDQNSPVEIQLRIKDPYTFI